MPSADIQAQLSTFIPADRLRLNKDISPYLTLRTHTVAEYYFEAETRDELIQAVNAAHELHLPILLLGGGSNLAITHSHIMGLTVRNMFQEKQVLNETEEIVEIRVSSGYSVNRFVNETSKAGYSGFEYHLGLPGTVGGAIYMNSKWTHGHLSYFGDAVKSATLLRRDGTIHEVDRAYFQFAYDYSVLQKTHEIVLDVVFILKKADAALLQQVAQSSLIYRKQTQPFGVSTCGCFFRNISEEEQKKANLPTKSAGYLIDKSGLKNTQIGDFRVSDQHANFVINTGQGKPEDLQKLLNLIKAKVHHTFGIHLIEEVVIR